MAKASLRTNIVAADPESASPLAFAGHLDTVSGRPAGDTDPFRTTIEQDRLTGLGAADMKGPIAAFSFGGSANGFPGAPKNRAHGR